MQSVEKGDDPKKDLLLPRGGAGPEDEEGGGPLSARDKRALALLVALCTSALSCPPRPSLTPRPAPDLLQGIPVGLAFGSIPFLLRSKLSYSQIGIFTLCTYPYSLKLLWSPIVDSIFSPKLGRRKSWIVPIQTVVGGLFWWLGGNVQGMMEVVSPLRCVGRGERGSNADALGRE